MAQVSPTQYETLIANYTDATEEINFIRTRLIKIGQIIQTSPQQNGNGGTWTRLVNKAENEKTSTGRPCSLECCDYTQQHTKRWRTVSCRIVRKEKRRLSPKATANCLTVKKKSVLGPLVGILHQDRLVD
jgi:hypothetical protein